MKDRRKIHIGKRLLAILALLLLMDAPSMMERTEAQVFILSEEEFNNSNRSAAVGGQVPLLPQGMEDDWYPMPIGEGFWILTALGGAYLLGKCKKRK